MTSAPLYVVANGTGACEKQSCVSRLETRAWNLETIDWILATGPSRPQPGFALFRAPKGELKRTNLCAAYDALSPSMKALRDGLTALNTANIHDIPNKGYIHPVVRKHRVTGRKALYVNGNFTKRIVELSADESKVLLEYLINWVKDPRFTVRWHWTQGAVAMWDNRQTQHCVVNDFDREVDGERLAQRVTIQGDIVQPGSDDAPRWSARLPFQVMHNPGKVLGLLSENTGVEECDWRPKTYLRCRPTCA